MIKVLCAIYLSLMAHLSFAATISGAVYPILERDPTEVIKEKLTKLDIQQLLNNRKESFRHQFQQATLPRVKENKRRSHIPFYTVEKEVLDKDGNVIYPIGYIYNPLLYFKLPYDIYVIDQSDIEWIRPLLKKRDMVLLHSGDINQVMHKLQHAVYILDDNTRQRLDIQRIPTKVSQHKDALLLEEFQRDF